MRVSTEKALLGRFHQQEIASRRDGKKAKVARKAGRPLLGGRLDALGASP
jgi:hypothetical protein